MARPRDFEEIDLVTARKRFERYLGQQASKNDGRPSPTTIGTYLRDLDEMIRLVGGGKRPVDDVEEEDIEDALVAIAKSPDRRYRDPDGRTRSVYSRARWAASVRAFFSWAVRQGYAHVSPADNVRVSTPPRRHAREGLTLEETRTLIAHMTGQPQGDTHARDLALISLMAESGPRVGEICALDVTDLRRLDRGSWVLRVVRGKGRKSRDVPVTDGMAELLRSYMGGERLEARARSRRHGAREPMFLTRNGSRMDPRDVQRMLDKACKRAGVRHTSPHGLRHTALTQMGIVGVAPQTLQEIAGHASLTTTSLYLDASDEENAAAVRSSPLAAGGGDAGLGAGESG